MSNQFKFLTVGALAALFTVNLALAQDATSADPAPHGRRPQGQGLHVPPEIRDQYDVNKDGQLDATELAALKADIASGKVALQAGHPAGGQGGRPEDHGRPVEKIAQDLGVTAEQFREAFKKVHPARPGTPPTEEQRQANRTALAQALGVAPEKLDAVMDKYRPEGKAGGRAGGPGGPGGGGHGHRPPSPEVLAKYDVNQDGKLDETERAQLEADIKSGAFVPPARLQHRPAGDDAPPADKGGPTIIPSQPRN